MSDFARLLALNAGFAAVGAAVVLLAGVPARRRWLSTIAGVAPAVGIATCGLASSLAAMIGIHVGLLSTGALVVGALLATRLIRGAPRPALGSLSAPRSEGFSRVVELSCLGALAVLSGGILRLSVASGLTEWDGWAMWGPKAHALLVDGDVWGPVFRAPAYAVQHPEYPVLLPALEALSAEAIGRFDATLIDIEPAIALVAFGLAAWAMLRLAVTPFIAASVALVLTGSAPLIVNSTANYADSVLAAFTALGLLGVFLWLTSGSTTMLFLAGIFLAAAASTKAEGLPFAVAAVAATGVVAHRFGRSIRTVATLACGVLAVPLVWMVVDRLNGPGSNNIEARAFIDPGYASAAADRVPTAAARLLGEIAMGWPIATLVVVAAVAVACLARLWWHALFVGLWAVLAFAALVVVYYSSTSPISWHLATSADRVVFSIVLGLATVAPLLVMPAWDRMTQRARETPPPP